MPSWTAFKMSLRFRPCCIAIYACSTIVFRISSRMTDAVTSLSAGMSGIVPRRRVLDGLRRVRRRQRLGQCPARKHQASECSQFRFHAYSSLPSTHRAPVEIYATCGRYQYAQPCRRAKALAYRPTPASSEHSASLRCRQFSEQLRHHIVSEML